MDTVRDILYRNFLFNDSSIAPDPLDAGNGSGITGSVVDRFDLSDVDIVQFREKRAQQDGMDAGPPFYGARRIDMAGTLYGKTRPLFYDALWALRTAASPIMALRDEPADLGYQPLYFHTPTANTDANVVADSGGKTLGYPSGVRDHRVLAMPHGISTPIQRDGQGGPDSKALAALWTARFVLKDPNIYASTAQDYDLSAGGTVTGNLVNRGNSIGVLNMLVVVGSAAGTITVQAGGATNFVITVPASTGNRTIRYKGFDKIITFEENSVETVRLGSTPVNMEHPVIAPGVSGYTVTFTGVTPTAGSHMWHWETFA